MFGSGYNTSSRFSIFSNKKYIYRPPKTHLNVGLLNSYSTYYDQSIWILKNGQAYAVGDNRDGKICHNLPKKVLDKETEIIIIDKNGNPFKFLSAVCGYEYTLYLVMGEASTSSSQLLYIKKNPLFLSINSHGSLFLYGGCDTAVAIDSEGGIFIIPQSISDSPAVKIEPIFMPDNEKPVKAAFCNEKILFLSLNGRVFECSLPSKGKQALIEVPELKGMTIVDISGICNHCLAVCDDGRVFGYGKNSGLRLGFDERIRKIDSFTVIKSLAPNKIVAAYAGGWHSLFKTSEGKILACGRNSYGELMLNNEGGNIYPPVEISIKEKVSFCVASNCGSVAFLEGFVPPSMPNTFISDVNKSSSSSKSSTIVSPKVKSSSGSKSPTIASPKVKSSSEIDELKKLIVSKNEENTKLKEELTRLKKENEELRKNHAKEIDDARKEIDKLRLARQEDKKAIDDLEKAMKKTGKSQLEVFDVSTLDKYERVKKLGRGSSSVVYEVVKKVSYALKILEFENDDDDENKEVKIDIEKLKRFGLEHEVLNQLDHPNIIKTYGICFGDSSHEPAILLQYCPSSLKKRIKKLSDSEKKQVIMELCSAMKEVHSAGIIHRDLKPENILLDDDNHVIVSDFGLCTLIEKESESQSRTQMAGSLKFMAPELLQGKTDYNEKVDIYAFGVVLYLVLNKGEYPNISVIDVGNGKQADIPKSFTKYSTDLIKKCWNFNASERPSFNEIFDSLQTNLSNLI